MKKVWALQEIQAVYDQPLLELIDHARQLYREHWPANEIQLCRLLSIKTGGCSEDCAYCAQSSRYTTSVKAERLMSVDEVLPVAQEAKAQGATRFCMGAAWKGVREGDKKFESVLETVREVSKLGMEVCVTLGELSARAAQELKEAGLTAYNHNLDTSPEFYSKIVSTHTFDDRLKTIEHVQKAGISVCCGGILGMGESINDRLRLLEVLSSFDPVPESIPINCLMAMEGTPLEGQRPIDGLELVRMIATTRILFPKARVRLSAGRRHLSKETQTLCFMAGANSIFYGDKLLTADNPEAEEDQALLKAIGFKQHISLQTSSS